MDDTSCLVSTEVEATPTHFFSKLPQKLVLQIAEQLPLHSVIALASKDHNVYNSELHQKFGSQLLWTTSP